MIKETHTVEKDITIIIIILGLEYFFLHNSSILYVFFFSFFSFASILLSSYYYDMMEYFCGFEFHQDGAKNESIQTNFLFSFLFCFVIAFLSCSPSPCKNSGVCITKPKAGSYCKWVSRLLIHSSLTNLVHYYYFSKWQMNIQT